MYIHRLLALGAIAVMLALFAACGSDEPTPTPTSAPETMAEQPTPTPETMMENPTPTPETMMADSTPTPEAMTADPTATPVPRPTADPRTPASRLRRGGVLRQQDDQDHHWNQPRRWLRHLQQDRGASG